MGNLIIRDMIMSRTNTTRRAISDLIIRDIIMSGTNSTRHATSDLIVRDMITSGTNSTHCALRDLFIRDATRVWRGETSEYERAWLSARLAVGETRRPLARREWHHMRLARLAARPASLGPHSLTTRRASETRGEWTRLVGHLWL